jgi:hypothetical protein
LDSETTGVLLFSKTAESHQAMNSLWQSRQVHKTYLALVDGNTPKEGKIDLPIMVINDGRKAKINEKQGKDALTLFGALMGASIANDAEKIANKKGRKVISQEVCETKVRQKIEKRLSHYLVTVDYAGRDVTFQSRRRPSNDVIKIEVTVEGLGN